MVIQLSTTDQMPETFRTKGKQITLMYRLCMHQPRCELNMIQTITRWHTWFICRSDNCSDVLDLNLGTGKPKIFLIQACRGIEEQEHVEEDDLPLLFKSDTLENLTTDARGYSTEKIPADADFIVAYATTPGYISIRDISKGAYFIRAFLTVAKKRYKDEHIEEILIHVKRELASNPDYVPLTGSLAGTCQMGMVESTSRKKLYL
ncbi:CASP7 [Mytilus edulis]|uniref:CASP7 n=1 Tax=Mytilus edulis TaxID=6550 RepID=A0A8S3UY00_MYTED|nr:CASP7 [Mytilus edulis]